MKKTKEEQPKRPTPGQKKFNLGLSVPKIQSPHLELVNAPDRDTSLPSPPSIGEISVSTPTPPSVANVEKTSLTSPPTTARTPSRPRQPSISSPSSPPTTPSAGETAPPIAPMSDFHKMANSNVRNAIPEGYFTSGKSKQVYDVMYSLTRGAIKPSRTITISKSKLMKLSNVGSKVTIDNIIERFCLNGLLRLVESRSGSHLGNEYEVYNYEEAKSRTDITASYTSLPSVTSLPSPSQKVVGLVTPETAQTSRGSEPVNIDVSAAPNTLFKDFLKDDDEKALKAVFEELQKSCREVTGSDMTASDWKAVPILIKQFIEATKTASNRTGQVTSFMQFGLENLRRKLNLVAPNKDRSKPTSNIKADPGKAVFTDNDIDEAVATYKKILSFENNAKLRVPATGAAKAVWEAALPIVKRSIGNEATFHTWFDQITLVGIELEKKILTVEANSITADWVSAYYSDFLIDALAQQGISGCEIKWENRSDLTSVEFKASFTDEQWKKIEDRLTT